MIVGIPRRIQYCALDTRAPVPPLKLTVDNATALQKIKAVVGGFSEVCTSSE
jgi:hypothetical protein